MWTEKTRQVPAQPKYHELPFMTRVMRHALGKGFTMDPVPEETPKQGWDGRASTLFRCGSR